MQCSICDLSLAAQAEHWYRACGHHECMACAIPMIRAGKTHCSRCGAPTRAGAQTLGNLVLGPDSEQVNRIERELVAERAKQVGGLQSLSPRDGKVVCQGREPEEQCDGEPFCVHFCYDVISQAAMRAEVEYNGASACAPALWAARVRQAVRRKMHPDQLVRCGFSAELFAYCGVSLRELLMRDIKPSLGVVSVSVVDAQNYALEHLLDAFRWTMADLTLLGLRITDLTRKYNYPLIVLYQKAGMRAEHLFAYDINYTDLVRCVLDQDARYANLLRLNLPFWYRALTITK